MTDQPNKLPILADFIPESGDDFAAAIAWSLSRQHAAGLRLVGKEILRDLWLAARTVAS